MFAAVPRLPVLLFLISIIIATGGGGGRPPPSNLDIIYAMKSKDEEQTLHKNR